MDTIIVKYSDFVEDDGGFEAVKKDFNKFGDELVADAKRIQKEVADALKFGDTKAFDEAEKSAEDLLKVSKKFEKTKANLTELEEEFIKAQKESAKSTEKYTKSLDKLNVEMEAHKVALKVINAAEKQGELSTEDAAVAKGRLRVEMKLLTKEIQRQEKEIIEANSLSAKEQKLLKAKITIQKEEIKTLEDVRERMAALRLVVQSLDLDKEADKIAAYNKEINELTDVLSENSDKFIQNKINIGNYEESITNALKGSKLFTTGIGQLDIALEATIGFLFITKKELDEMEEAGGKNIGMLKKLALAFGRLNKVLKASIIGVVLVAIGALSSAFGDTVAGAIRTEKVMKTLSTTLATFGKVASILFSALGEGFIILFDSIVQGFDAIKNLSLKEILTGDIKLFEVIGNNSKKFFSNLKTSLNDVVNAVKSGADAVILGLENIDKALKLEFETEQLTNEIDRLTTKLALMQITADDSTKSLNTQLLANKAVLELSEKLGNKQLIIAQKNLEATNERVKQNILANVVEAKNINLGLKGQAFAEATLALAQKRGISLEISKELILEQQEALRGVEEAERELAVTRGENDKKRREIQRDLFEQNLDLLIDLIDTEKNLSEAYVNDVTKNFESRVNEFNRFLDVFRRNSQRVLDEFTKDAKAAGDDLNFQIEYQDDGSFKVFVNDQELAIDNIVELNKQLQNLGENFNKIDINRFREFIVETRNGVRDMRLLAIETRNVGFAVRELRGNLLVSQDEINALKSLQDRIDALTTATRGKITPKQRKEILKQLEELEKQKEAIAKFGEFQRLKNREEAIKAELATVERGSQREAELKQELLDIEKQLLDEQVQATIDANKKANDKSLEQFEKLKDAIKQLTDAILDRLDEVAKKRVDKAEEEKSKQESILEKQEERARLGLENTLAFEQKMLAKREADLLKQQKRQERLDKVKALYSSYSNYASKGEENALAKTLRDFAILEAITASFGDGGAAEDVLAKVPTNGKGITRGRSHQGRNGGIPVLIEGREGFFSSREMSNLGKDNFYAIKNLAGNGPLSENFFSGQKEEFTKLIPVGGGRDPKLVKEMQGVKRAIENKPVSSLDVKGLADGILDIMETVKSKNKTIRNHYKINKRRL